MSNRVPESVDGAGRVDNGWGEETLPLNRAEGLSEGEVVLVVLEAPGFPPWTHRMATARYSR
jgi:hypothetical protein